MEIHELSARTTLENTDVFAVDTGSVTNKVTLPNLITAVKGEIFSGASVNGITQYPTKPGLYRLTGSTIEGMPSGATKYGLLRIESATPGSSYSYASHVYTDSNNGVYVGYTSDTFGVPSNWVNITGIIPISRGGSGQSTEAGLRGVVFNSSVTSGITTYPTTPGLYRVTSSCAGLPSGATFYGVLAIFGAGGYYMHLFAGSDNNLYYGYKGSSGAPTSWRKVTGTSVNPVS